MQVFSNGLIEWQNGCGITRAMQSGGLISIPRYYYHPYIYASIQFALLIIFFACSYHLNDSCGQCPWFLWTLVVANILHFRKYCFILLHRGPT